MNPFDLRGPQFLVFYVVLFIVVMSVVGRLRRRMERDRITTRRAPLDDPFLIASLRGDASEVIRVACVSLLDRGLLKMDNWMISTTEVGAQTSVRRPVEQKILASCKSPKKFEVLERDKELLTTARAYDHDLERLQLLPDAGIRSVRRRLFLAAFLVLGGTAVIKIMVALSRGRTNIGVLIVFAIFASFFLIGASFPRRTTAGDSMLAELKNLFESLKLRPLRTGGVSNDVLLIAAVYGATALPAESFPWTAQLRMQPTQPSSSSSSDGSSSSSCGSSCGGGCGGGCGGCGS